MNISRIESVFNFFVNVFLICCCLSEYLNLTIFSKDLFTSFIMILFCYDSGYAVGSAFMLPLRGVFCSVSVRPLFLLSLSLCSPYCNYDLVIIHVFVSPSTHFASYHNSVIKNRFRYRAAAYTHVTMVPST